jgi:hypothetical protein
VARDHGRQGPRPLHRLDSAKKDKNFANLKGYNLTCDEVTDINGVPDKSHTGTQWNWAIAQRSGKGWDRVSGRIGGPDYRSVIFCDKP